MDETNQIPPPIPVPSPDYVSSSSRKKFPFLIVLLAILTISLLSLIFYFVRTQQQSNQKLEEVSSRLQNLQQQNTQLNSEKQDLTAQNEDLTSQIDMIKSPPYSTNYMPVKYFQGDYQKTAQVFTLKSPKNISGVRFQASFGIGNLTMALYEVASDSQKIDASGPLVQKQFSGQLVIKGQPLEVLFPNPVVLESGKKYALVFTAADNKSEIDVGFAESDIKKDGTMYIFSRVIGGNGEILDSKFSWQPRNTNDLIYELVSLPGN